MACHAAKETTARGSEGRLHEARGVSSSIPKLREEAPKAPLLVITIIIVPETE